MKNKEIINTRVSFFVLCLSYAKFYKIKIKISFKLNIFRYKYFNTSVQRIKITSTGAKKYIEFYLRKYRCS